MVAELRGWWEFIMLALLLFAVDTPPDLARLPLRRLALRLWHDRSTSPFLARSEAPRELQGDRGTGPQDTF